MVPRIEFFSSTQQVKRGIALLLFLPCSLIKGKHLYVQRRPRNRATHNRSNCIFVQNLVGPNRQKWTIASNPLYRSTCLFVQFLRSKAAAQLSGHLCILYLAGSIWSEVSEVIAEGGSPLPLQGPQEQFGLPQDIHGLLLWAMDIP